jgi:AcrR family transcriptional regulator
MARTRQITSGRLRVCWTTNISSRQGRSPSERPQLRRSCERDLGDITPSDVAARAGVSRSTFYDHFTDLHVLAVVACTEQFDELLAVAPTEMLDDVEGLRARLGLFFSHIQTNKRLYLALLGPADASQCVLIWGNGCLLRSDRPPGQLERSPSHVQAQRSWVAVWLQSRRTG